MPDLIERDATYAVELSAIGTHIRLVTTDAAALPEARAMLVERLDDLDRAASRFRSDAQVSRINAASTAARDRGDETLTVRVSPLLAACVRAAIRTDLLTDGLVTPTVGRALFDAGYDDDLDLVRSRAPRWGRQTPHAAHRDGLRLADLSLTIHAGTILDLGASAKAFAADEWARAITARVGGGVLVDLGGDLASAGTPPPGGWRVGVTDRDGVTRHTVTATRNQAFATSSTQLRTWIHDGRRRHHIIDPRTGTPAETSWAQVTCAGPNALQANAASTAAIILADGAIDWLTARHIPALLIATTGDEFRTCGWPADDEPLTTTETCR